MLGNEVDYRKMVERSDSPAQIGVTIVVCLLTIFGIVWCVHLAKEHKQKQDINVEVNAAVSQYFALRGDEPSKNKVADESTEGVEL